MGNKKIINIVATIVLSILFVLAFWQQGKIKRLENTVQLKSDSIGNLRFQNALLASSKDERMSRSFGRNSLLDTFPNLVTNDSIIESDRIILELGSNIRVFNINVFKDTSVLLSYKNILANNPFTSNEKSRIVNSHTQKLDKKVWQEFKNRFSKIDNYELTHYDGFLDCFGNNLTWEAKIKYDTYFFHTYCNLAPNFASACEWLMRQTQEKEIQQYFEREDEFKKTVSNDIILGLKSKD